MIAGSWLGGAQAGSHDVLMWERSGRRIHLRRLLQADDVRQKGGEGKDRHKDVPEGSLSGEAAEERRGSIRQ